MFLEDLEIVNFGIIQKEKFSFKKGLHFFSGDNGQGKSTVLRAVVLLLFDKSDLKLEDFLRWDAPGEPFFLSATFTHLGVKYKAEMSYLTSTTRTLYVGDDPTPFKNSEAIAKLASILDPKVALSAMVSMEGDIDLISISPAERRDHLRKIYDVSFETEKAVLEQAESSSMSARDRLEGELLSLRAKTFDEVPVPVLRHSSREKEKAQEELVLLSSVRARGEVLTSQVEQWEGEVSKAVSSGTKASLSAEEAKVSLKKIETSLSELSAKEDQDRLDWKLKASSLEGKLRETAPELASLEEELVSVKVLRIPPFPVSERDEALADHQKAVISLQRLEEDLTSLEAGKCPTCGEPYTPERISSKREAVAAQREMAHSFLVVAQDWNQKQAEHQTKLEENDKAKARKSELERRVSEKKVEREKMSSELASAKQALETLGETYALRRELLASSKKTSQEALEGHLQEAKKQEAVRLGLLAKIEAHAKELSDLKLGEVSSRTQTATTVIAEYNQDVAKIESVKEQNVRIRKDKTETGKLVVEKEKALQRILTDLEEIKQAKKIVGTEFPTYVILYLTQELEKIANSFLTKTYGGRYALTFSEKRGSLYILYGPKQKDLKAASGYEKQVFGMALKYAFNRMQGLGVLILDEVDSAASTKNSKLFYQTLAEASSEFEQIFCISHKDVASDLEFDRGAAIYTFVNGRTA